MRDWQENEILIVEIMYWILREKFEWVACLGTRRCMRERKKVELRNRSSWSWLGMPKHPFIHSRIGDAWTVKKEEFKHANFARSIPTFAADGENQEPASALKRLQRSLSVVYCHRSLNRENVCAEHYVGKSEGRCSHVPREFPSHACSSIWDSPRRGNRNRQMILWCQRALNEREEATTIAVYSASLCQVQMS